MMRGQWLACVMLGWLVLAPMSGHVQGVKALDPFTCEDLVGLTYRVWILRQGFVCFEFVSADTVIQTYDPQGSVPVGYTIKKERPGVCRILTEVPFQPIGGLVALITSEVLVGYGDIPVPGGILVPVVGYNVTTGECQPG